MELIQTRISVGFRQARPGDVSHLVALVNSAYRGEVAKKGWTFESDLLDGERINHASMKKMIMGAASRIEVAIDPGGEILGCVHLHKENQKYCHFGMLTVNPSLQACGIGKKILYHSERIAAHWGCRFLRGEVIHLREELIQFYLRYGFVLSGRSAGFFCKSKARQELRLLEIVKVLG